MPTRNLILLALIGALSLTGLVGCGKKGTLEAPQPHSSKEKPKDSN